MSASAGPKGLEASASFQQSDGYERIGAGSLIGAGALVTARTEVPPGSLVLGSPAKVVRPLQGKEREMIENGWLTYVEFAGKMKAELLAKGLLPEVL